MSTGRFGSGTLSVQTTKYVVLLLITISGKVITEIQCTNPLNLVPHFEHVTLFSNKVFCLK